MNLIYNFYSFYRKQQQAEKLTILATSQKRRGPSPLCRTTGPEKAKKRNRGNKGVVNQRFPSRAEEEEEEEGRRAREVTALLASLSVST